MQGSQLQDGTARAWAGSRIGQHEGNHPQSPREAHFGDQKAGHLWVWLSSPCTPSQLRGDRAAAKAPQFRRQQLEAGLHLPSSPSQCPAWGPDVQQLLLRERLIPPPPSAQPLSQQSCQPQPDDVTVSQRDCTLAGSPRWG